MLRLENSALCVDVLSPSGDGSARHHGFRYCRGGYVWAITDKNVGLLLTGPEGSAPNPDPHNGHGLPESFRYREFGTGRTLTLTEGEGLVLGVGHVRERADKTLELLEKSPWDCVQTNNTLTFSTRQVFGPWDVRIQRVLRLEGRTLTSETTVTQRGSEVLDLQWFAHPFFPLTDGRIECQIPASYGMTDNAGFVLTSENKISHRRVFDGIYDGHFEALRLDEATTFAVTVSHPRLDSIRFEASFVPAFCPIWGNGHTWSIEPYLYRKVTPASTTSWSLRYTFGASRI